MKKLLLENTPEKWNEIATNAFYQTQVEKIREEAFSLLSLPIENLRFTEFLMYSTTGNRLLYENNYFNHRKRLNVFAFMYLLTKEKKYLEALEDSIWAVCDEFTWALPAHIPSNLDMEKQAVYLDLFSSETGYTLSEIYHMVGEDLPDMLRRRIYYEVNKRIINSFLVVFPINSWETMDNNWAAVCAGSVGNSFLYLGTQEEFEQAKPRLFQCFTNFLSGYPRDGACLEGYTYWQYGFGYYLQFSELYSQYTNGQEDLLKLKKVENIAKFQQNAIVSDNLSIPFSDANIVTLQQDLYMTHYLYQHFEGIEIPDINYSYRFKDDHCYRWGGFIRNFLWTNPILPTCTRKKKSWYFEEAQWYLKNGDNYSFIAKAGNNGEPHNHNDIGNFCISRNNQYVIDDLGAGEYVADYFVDKTRYDFLVNSSRGHSVPIINGCYQVYGKNYEGAILEATEETLTISMEDAYEIPGLKKLERHFDFKATEVIMTDYIQLEQEPQSLIERLISKQRPNQMEEYVSIGDMAIRYDKEQLECVLQEEEYKGHHGENNTAYFIDFISKQSTCQQEICLKFQF